MFYSTSVGKHITAYQILIVSFSSCDVGNDAVQCITFFLNSDLIIDQKIYNSSS